jgi:hypothetical protein
MKNRAIIRVHMLKTKAPSQARWKRMSLEIANSNVNRNITLAGTSVAIFTFVLFFLYPRYRTGDIDPSLFQFTIAVIVSVIFCLVISVLYYYVRVIQEVLRKEQLMSLLGYG